MASSFTLWADVSDLARPTHPKAQIALETASELLSSMVGGLYTGVRTVTEMYSTARELAVGAQFYPGTWAATDYRIVRPGCECNSCGILHRIRLRGQPTRHIFDVTIDGCKLLPTEYVLLDHSVLGFLTPRACCAGCVTVRYEFGTPPPSAGRFAATKLANELIASLDPDADCQLPQRVTSISRQGVSWTLLDSQDFLEDGRTGLYEVDLFLKTFNPARALRPARVFSPDRPRAQTVVMEYPPLSAVLQPDDLVVVPGSPAAWVIADERTVRLLLDPKYTPRLQIAGQPEIRLTVTNLHDGRVSLYVPAENTAHISYGAPWKLFAHNTLEPKDELLMAGEARTL